jgi:hypothetical protein
LTRAVTVVAPQQRSEPAMQDDIWNDDDSWWHHMDQMLEQQWLEEQQRIDACNKALAELMAVINEELEKINAK